jgi:hypothetical protein
LHAQIRAAKVETILPFFATFSIPLPLFCFHKMLFTFFRAIFLFPIKKDHLAIRSADLIMAPLENARAQKIEENGTVFSNANAKFCKIFGNCRKIITTNPGSKKDTFPSDHNPKNFTFFFGLQNVPILFPSP